MHTSRTNVTSSNKANDSNDSVVVGVLGGGQLGKMLSMAAAKLGFRTSVFAEHHDDPAVFVTNNSVVGSFVDEEKLQQFAAMVDVVIVEFENIPMSSVNFLQQTVTVCPGAKALYVAQNRIREKEHIKALGVELAEFAVVNNFVELKEAASRVGLPAILKTAESGYDGRGQYMLQNAADIEGLLHISWNKGYVLEKLVAIEKEISVVIALSCNGEHIFFPVAQNLHVAGILHKSEVPAVISEEILLQAEDIALTIAKSLDTLGILAVEFFITRKGALMVNEIAPRPHNSCHWSIDCCNVSQFEQLVRIACGLPLREVHLLTPCIMTNILGNNELGKNVYGDARNSISLYGKKPRTKRKMGHINSLKY
ncbi:5-(carboxyamino)imidazole ribonucleotide synthase [Anaplasma platys]|uniref:N5-carboxyaminoimidazole ribonucleotide synthase n=1 Tax=Anaplasma platys TaxID=949 RepID=A0A858PYZ6_9RICK|nr:5-(carboxyamino)imidazole ribonucleotide synthase [Anaplasma platys]QJC27784.1 5-(carboxyamino)imidazole ribonucleotide synthase [Anaplasma platys]